MTCELCRTRVATHVCRRCGRRVCWSCMTHHGLCKSCRESLPRVVRRAVPG